MLLETTSSSSSSSSSLDFISNVRSAISNWDPHISPSPSFLRATSQLHLHLLHLSSKSSGSSKQPQLMKIHTLLESAMQHLQDSLKRHLFSISPPHLPADKITTTRSIAETMLSAGYGEECISIYQSMRRSNLKSQMVRLLFDQAANQPKAIRKLTWENLHRKVKSWTQIAPIVVQSLCSHEQRLCDEIFAASRETVRDTLFSSIVCDTALSFLSFPEMVSLNLKASPEKLFQLLDMYVALSNLLPDIESIFRSELTSKVRSQAVSSLEKLSEAIRVVISKFELAIQKDPLKSSGTPGGAVHPLTRYVMNYLAYLSDFEFYLHEILVDLPPKCDTLFFKQSNLEDESVVSVTIAWMLFVLLCKMDSKAETYSEVALSYLFLANNLQYMVTKVKSYRLKEILGDEWVREHISKACGFMKGHVRSGWAHLPAMLFTGKEAEDVDRLQEFDVVFEKVMKERKDWVIADAALRGEVRHMVKTLLVPTYCEWYRTRKNYLPVGLSLEQVKKTIMRLYGDSDQI